IFVGLATKTKGESAKIAQLFSRNGYATIDITGDEMAKEHIRHLVGGRSPLAENELLYRFEFPERPGALMKFLTAMNPSWNISLFHYRNQGADYGRILVGIQVPQSERSAFKQFVADLGYPFVDESQSILAQLFLR
ncbi:MAG: threonine ammonia-lyase, biosynthetic, partial [Arenimonas sp.]|nr:threonine ammonia-lyase, biosynthetic [Arenimonas sp.]